MAKSIMFPPFPIPKSNQQFFFLLI